MKRSQAAALIDEIREVVAKWEAGQLAESLAMARVALCLAQKGIPNLTPCPGEAHSNAFIDNCSECAPRWGFVGKAVKVT